MSSSVKLFGNTLSTYKSASKTNEDRLKFYDSFLKSVQGFSTIPHNANNYDDPPIEKPTITPTASTENTSDNGMSAILKVVEEFGKVDYTPTTGGGFADFLKKYGNENARAYSEAVRVANDSFYRSMMNYGKNAEMLAGNGLTSSGVSDYGNAAAYAARQGAVTEAGKARLQADTDAMAHYTGQIALANAEAQREARKLANTKVNTFLSAMEQTNLDETSARMLATQAGIYDEDEINMFVDAAKKLGEQRRLEADAAQAKIDAENEAAQKETRFMNTLTAFESLIASGKTADEAKEYLSFVAPQYSQYDPDAIENIYNNHVNVQNMGKSDDPNYVYPNDETYKVNLAAATEAYNKSRADGNSHETALSGVKTAGITDERILNQLKTNYDSGIINNAQNSLQQMLASANYSVAQKATSEGGKYVSKEYLDNLVAQNILTEDSEAYKNQLDQLQAKNSESLMNLIDGAHDNGAKGFDLRMACAEFGIAYDEANKEAVGAEVVKAARERAEELYLAGDISAKQYSDYIKTDFDYEIYAYQDEGNILCNLCGSLVSLSDYVDQIDGISEEVYNELLDVALEQMEILDVEYDKTTVGGEPALKISYKNKNTRFKENVKLEFQSKGLSAGVVDYEKHGDVISEFVTTNGLKFDKYESGGYKISNVNLNPHSLRYALNYNNYIHSELSNKKFSTDMGNVILDLMERQFSSK